MMLKPVSACVLIKRNVTLSTWLYLNDLHHKSRFETQAYSLAACRIKHLQLSSDIPRTSFNFMPHQYIEY